MRPSMHNMDGKGRNKTHNKNEEGEDELPKSKQTTNPRGEEDGLLKSELTK